MTKLLVLALMPVLLGSVLAELDFIWPDTKCTKHTAQGRTTCCFWPTCRSGKKGWFGDACKDPGLSMYCPENSIYRDETLDRIFSDEVCDPSTTLTWSTYTYNWTCCECPAGYKNTAKAPNCDILDEERCVGCTKEYERPVQNKTTKVWKCSVFCQDKFPQPCVTAPDRPAGKCAMDDKGVEFLKKQEGWCSTYYLASGPGTNSKTIGTCWFTS
jgi:hypothetical protein